LPQLEGEQALAAEPRVHAALSASAGTGKTQVLTARVLRLLLQGARPESILCLTFTKAAAAEMANRIGARLAAWVRLPDKLLKKDLFALGERDDPRTRQRARQLFARVLDCPGGLKIQTIHAFAQSLLAAFPAEAGITPGFQPIEGRAEQELVRRTLADLMADAEERGDSALIGDVQCLSRRLGEFGAVEYLQACARKPEAMERLGPAETIEPLLRARMRLPKGSLEQYLAVQCGDDGFDCDLLRAIASANRAWGTSKGAKIVDDIERWLQLPSDARAAALPDLSLVVFTGKGELRKTQAGQLKADADYDRHVEKLASKIAELLQVQRASKLAADIAAGLRAGQAFAAAYTRAKRAAGVADFNDLIDWTRRLLASPGMGDWVRYKLDRDVDHVLVDEAQDTNAAQWEIIESIVEEYFSGSSESEQRRFTGDFGLQRPPALRLVRALQVGDPVDGFQQPRRPQRAKHRMNRLVAKKLLGARAKLARVAIVMLQPFLEHLVNGLALPPGGMVGVDRVFHSKLQDRARIESERVRFQPVDRGDRNLCGALFGRRRWRRPISWNRRTRIVERPSDPFEHPVARKAGADCVQTQQEARRHRRRAALAFGARDEDFGRPERAREIVGGKADAELERRHAESRSNLGRKPRVGRGKRGPHAFIEAAKHQ
jgi:hypothetical protein